MANEIKAITIDGTRRTIKDETARNAAQQAQTTANSKQDELTFDTAPTSGSNNPVTSGGVYTAMQSFAPELPIASEDTLGGVKVDGTTITADENGVISGASTYTLPTASTSQLGGVKVDGDTITIDANGVISGASESATPDWNVSDSTKAGYIANRPFYHAYNTNQLLDETEFGGTNAKYGITIDYVNYALVAENVSLDDDIVADTRYAVTVDDKTSVVYSSESSVTYTLSGTDGTTKTVSGIRIFIVNSSDNNYNCIIIRTGTNKASILIKGVASTQFVTPTKTIGFGEYVSETLQTIPLMYLPIDWTYITTDENNDITLDIQAIKDAIDALGGE